MSESPNVNPAAPSLEGIPPDTVLPIWAATPHLLDWNFKSRLAPAQLALLNAFLWLSYSRKAPLVQNALPTDSISYHLIKQAVDEQIRERGLRSENTLPLEDTTKSELA